MKRYIKSSTNPIEVFNTGGNIWFAEMDLGDGTYAVVSNACQLPPLTLTSFAKKWELVTIR